MSVSSLHMTRRLLALPVPPLGRPLSSFTWHPRASLSPKGGSAAFISTSRIQSLVPSSLFPPVHKFTLCHRSPVRSMSSGETASDSVSLPLVNSVWQIPVEQFEKVRASAASVSGRDEAQDVNLDDDSKPGSEGGVKVQLVDVREPDEIAIASVPGFKAFPLSRFPQWAPTVMDSLDPEVDTFVLCHHGLRSQQAAQWLASQGFEKVYNVVGGIHQYSVKVDPSIGQY